MKKETSKRSTHARKALLHSALGYVDQLAARAPEPDQQATTEDQRRLRFLKNRANYYGRRVIAEDLLKGRKIR